jgi:nucleotide-binding universal stress UspA family protein
MLQAVDVRDPEVLRQFVGTVRPVRSPSPRVLLPLDGSPAAAVALPTARAIAEQLGLVVEVLHVAPRELSGAEVRDRLQLEGEDSVEFLVRVGDPAQEILQIVNDPEVAIVVMTTHGHEIENRRGLTSVATAVAAQATRPVLFVCPEMAAQRTGPIAPLHRFLVPLEGDPTTAGALWPAMDLVTRLDGSGDSKIDLLVVAHPNQTWPQQPGTIRPPYYVDQPHYEWPLWNRRVRGWLRDCCREVSPGMPIHVFLSPGLAHSEVGSVIAAFASDHQEDAIILVRRSHLQPGRAAVLRRVLHEAPCPVLMVPGPPSVAAGAPAARAEIHPPPIACRRYE